MTYTEEERAYRKNAHQRRIHIEKVSKKKFVQFNFVFTVN